MCTHHRYLVPGMSYEGRFLSYQAIYNRYSPMDRQAMGMNGYPKTQHAMQACYRVSINHKWRVVPGIRGLSMAFGTTGNWGLIG